jgi:hypothetical protein
MAPKKTARQVVVRKRIEKCEFFPRECNAEEGIEYMRAHFLNNKALREQAALDKDKPTGAGTSDASGQAVKTSCASCWLLRERQVPCVVCTHDTV